MAKTVLITGGTGYIGAWTVKYALEKGYNVRLSVRDKKQTAKYEFLQKIAEKSAGNLEIFEANLLQKGSFDAAAEGADWIFHLASPFTLRFKDAQKDLVDPALLGTENVLNAASASSTVEQVVLTSSVAAVCGDNADMKTLGVEELDESHFNFSSSVHHQPYPYSKVAAEKKAWEIHDAQNKWKLKVINPSFVMGPSLSANSNSESLQFMKDFISGKFLMGAPDLFFGFVDVRDVAMAHIMAAENNEFKGRCILVAEHLNMVQLSAKLKPFVDAAWKLPKAKAPKFLLKLLAPLFGITAKFVEQNIGHPIQLNNRKSKEMLNINYRDLNDTLKEMLDQM